MSEGFDALSDDAWKKEVIERLERIEAALTSPPAIPRPRKSDETYQAVLEFMRANPIRLTALVIEQNTGIPNTVVGSRLSTLIREGLVESKKDDGRQATFKITDAGLVP